MLGAGAAGIKEKEGLGGKKPGWIRNSWLFDWRSSTDSTKSLSGGPFLKPQVFLEPNFACSIVVVVFDTNIF